MLSRAEAIKDCPDKATGEEYFGGKARHSVNKSILLSDFREGGENVHVETVAMCCDFFSSESV